MTLVGVEDDPAVDVARGAADGLDQRGLAAQEAFLVGVEDGDQRAFGNVEALAQQVDADQRVERAEPQVADDLDALDGVDVGVHVAHADALLVQVFGEVLGHALGQHGDQRAVALPRHRRHLADQVVDLACAPGGLRPADRSGRSGGSPARRTRRRSAPSPTARAWPRRRRSAAASRPIPRSAAAGCPCSDGRRKPYSASVALRRKSPRYMPPSCGTVTWLSSTNTSALSGTYSNKRRRRLAGLAAGEIARIVLDAGAAAGRLHHLEVEDACAARAAAPPAAGRRR